MSNKYDKLKLENQLCFPLYAASKEIVRHYKPFLDKLDMTYTQYIAMMVLWEHKKLNVKELGEYLYLDSGTLTPLLKTMEKKGWIERKSAECYDNETGRSFKGTGIVCAGTDGRMCAFETRGNSAVISTVI